MNATSSSETRSLSLVDIIDLKWLLAREGVHLHVEKLQQDPAYARELLACAETSPNEPLQDAARRVRELLASTDPGG